MSVNSKMTAIADKIRELLGYSGRMNLDAMASNLDDAVNECDTQADLIAQIKTALDGKAGGGGTVLPTLTNPGTAIDLAEGKQLIDENGQIVVGTVKTVQGSYFAEYSEIMENDEYISPYLIVDQHTLLRDGVPFYIDVPKSVYGNATAADVAQGKTFTSENGLRITGTATSGGASVKTATAKPSTNSTSISFTGLTAQPKMFAVCPTGNITFNTQNRFIVNVMYDGTTTRGIYAFGSGSWNATYTGTHSATYFSWTYNNGTLTITASSNTNGGYFASGVTYQLTYAV